MSAMPGRMRAVVCRGMEQVQAVLVEAQAAEAVAPSRMLNVLGMPHPHICTGHPTCDLLQTAYRNGLSGEEFT